MFSRDICHEQKHRHSAG